MPSSPTDPFADSHNMADDPTTFRRMIQVPTLRVTIIRRMKLKKFWKVSILLFRKLIWKTIDLMK